MDQIEQKHVDRALDKMKVKRVAGARGGEGGAG